MSELVIKLTDSVRSFGLSCSFEPFQRFVGFGAAIGVGALLYDLQVDRARLGDLVGYLIAAGQRKQGPGLGRLLCFVECCRELAIGLVGSKVLRRNVSAGGALVEIRDFQVCLVRRDLLLGYAKLIGSPQVFFGDLSATGSILSRDGWPG